jgi:hypothetical protein
VIKKLQKRVKKFLRSAKHFRIASVIGLTLLTTAIPLTVYVLQQQHDIRQHAQVSANCVYTETYQGKPVINVKSFGAVGDGATDDREAIQNTINCFKNSKTSGVVYIPSGTYKLSKRLYLPSNIVLFGDDVRSGDSLQSSTILQLTTTKDYLLYNDNATGHENITVRNITLKGMGIDDLDKDAERCCAGIEFHDLDGGLIKDVTIQGFNDNGIHFDRYISEKNGVRNVIIDGVKAIENKRSGIAINSGSSNVINNSIINNNNKGENADSWSTSKRDAALILELGKSGTISDNKLIGNTVSSNGVVAKNSGGGIAVRTDTRTNDRIIQNNAVCKNTVENNGDVGIAEANGTGDIYIANVIRKNQDRNDGKIVICDQDSGGCQNQGNNAYEDESPNATNAACDISQKLATIPVLPQK